MAQKTKAIVYGILLIAIASSFIFMSVVAADYTRNPELETIIVRGVKETPTPIVAPPDPPFHERNLFNQIITPLPTPTKMIKPTPTPTPIPWAVMWLVQGVMGDCAIIRDYTLYPETLCVGEKKDNVKLIKVDDYEQTVTIEHTLTGERIVLKQGVERIQ